MATAAEWLKHAKLRGENVSLSPVTTLAITFTCLSIHVKVVWAQGTQTRTRVRPAFQNDPQVVLRAP